MTKRRLHSKSVARAHRKDADAIQSTRGTAGQAAGEKGRTWEEALAHASAVEHEALTTENRAYRGLFDDQGTVGRAQMDA